MKFLLLIAVLIACASALPQNEGRTRLRGARRFPLANPGLRNAEQQQSETSAVDVVEEEAPAVSEDQPRTRSRGTSLLRRGRPSPASANRASPPLEERSRATVDVNVEEGNPNDASSSRGGLKIRRPRKKITTSTTTAATTTVALETETMMTKLEEMPVKEDIMMVKDEAADKEISPASEPEAILEKEVAEESPSKAPESLSPVSAPAGDSAGQGRPKLRPIPIKIGRRGNAETNQLEPRAESGLPKDQDTTSSISEPVSSSPHRFSARPRPRIQSRAGSRGKPSEAQAEQEQSRSNVADQQQEESPEPAKPKSRTRVPSLKRPSGRRRTSDATAAAAAVPEEISEVPQASEDSQAGAAPEQDTETRFPSIKELRTILKRPSSGKVKTPTSPLTSSPKPKETGLNFKEQPTEKETPAKETLPQNLPSEIENIPEPVKDSIPPLEDVLEVSPEPLQEKSPLVIEEDLLIPEVMEEPLLHEILNEADVPDTMIQEETGAQNPSFSAPISDSVLKGRPKKIRRPPQKTPSPDPETTPIILAKGHPETSSMDTKFPTPNYGGPGLTFRGGEIHVTQIGTVEDSPVSEVRQILSGLGSRRRGLGKPKEAPTGALSQRSSAKQAKMTNDAAPSNKQETIITDVDSLYDYAYDYDGPILS